MTYSLTELATAAHTIASWRASKYNYWNAAYVTELKKLGFRVVALDQVPEHLKGKSILAPAPRKEDHYTFAFPAMLLPKELLK